MKAFSPITNIAGLLVFGYFAYLQVNDADPEVYHRASGWDAYLWLLFYGLVALVFLLALAGSVPRGLLFAVAAFCVIQLVVTTPGMIDNLTHGDGFTITGAQMAPERPRVELSREFLGALIGFLGMGLVWWRGRRR